MSKGFVIPKVLHAFVEDSTVISQVGSTVTNPGDKHRDEDWLMLLPGMPGGADIDAYFKGLGWTLGGSTPTDEGKPRGADEVFWSYTIKDERGLVVNLILTFSEIFYDRFMLATHVAKELVIPDKCKRIVLFQAILYESRVYTAHVTPTK